jgi:hypothetical protein
VRHAWGLQITYKGAYNDQTVTSGVAFKSSQLPLHHLDDMYDQQTSSLTLKIFLLLLLLLSLLFNFHAWPSSSPLIYLFLFKIWSIFFWLPLVYLKCFIKFHFFSIFIILQYFHILDLLLIFLLLFILFETVFKIKVFFFYDFITL